MHFATALGLQPALSAALYLQQSRDLVRASHRRSFPMNGGTYEKVTAALACNEATVSTPDILPVAANGRLIIKRPAIPLWLTAVSPALATVALGGVLLSTIYFTLLDWQWVAFLGGVLFAALLALASRALQAEWAISRRVAELTRVRDELSRETAAKMQAEAAAWLSINQLRLLSDAMTAMVAYIDAGQRIRFHNRMFREWLGLRSALVDGQLLCDVLGLGVYAEIEDKVARALAGEQVHYERTQTVGKTLPRDLKITYLPHFDANRKVMGFLALLEDAAVPTFSLEPLDDDAVRAGTEHRLAQNPLVVTDEGGQTLYLRSMTEQLTGWSDPQQRLRHALDSNEFRLYCQDIAAVFDDSVQQWGYEILIRLKEEEENLTPPGAFIPVAEQFNMTTDLDCWVVRNVLSWHGAHRRKSPAWTNSIYFINLFTSSIHDANFVEYVRKQLADNQVPPHVLCFEVSEQEAVSGHPAVAKFVGDLRRIGCRISLGGFGGGKVSFDTLKHLPVDFLKIDGDLVRNVIEDPVSQAKIRAIARVSKVIGMKTIAQFAESDHVVNMLAQLQIDYAQGFAIGKPRSIDQVVVL
jgi:EAL domain-containing protein (putative c-di-GMP-specific phosphodiesterase class I)